MSPKLGWLGRSRAGGGTEGPSSMQGPPLSNVDRYATRGLVAKKEQTIWNTDEPALSMWWPAVEG